MDTLSRHGRRAKRVPDGATQHRTAGPYSPVLEINADRLVVVSGQVASDLDGNIVGATIEEQTAATLRNCEMQLASAGASLEDVFKVNVYLSDIGLWARFNEIYRAIMPAPLPVRTAVQAILLPGFIVELDMWAAKQSSEAASE